MTYLIFLKRVTVFYNGAEGGRAATAKWSTMALAADCQWHEGSG